jgi:hypothetical protein
MKKITKMYKDTDYQLLYYSKLDSPEPFPETRVVNLRFSWLAKLVAKVLNRIVRGVEIYEDSE